MKYTGSIITGQGRGKKLGFPTFNLKIPPHFPFKTGIYACWVWLNRTKYPGALHFGPIPVFHQLDNHLEIHVLDCFTPAPTKTLIFEIVKFLRPIKNFPSPPALSHQIAIDVTRIRKLLASPDS